MMFLFSKAIQGLWYHVKVPKCVSRLFNLPFMVYSSVCKVLPDRGQITPLLPVIGIGNLVVGGTGKTPFTLWLARELVNRGLKPALVARGYKRTGSGICRVILGGELEDDCKIFGDEPFLLASNLPDCPVWVGKKWMAAAIAGGISGLDVVIVDDALQHRSLKKDAEIVLFDAHFGFGNGLLLPFGPLRDPPNSLKKATLCVFVGTNFEVCYKSHRELMYLMEPRVPVFYARKKIFGIKYGKDLIDLENVGNLPVFAFAGISKPTMFFQHLLSVGLNVAGFFGFPDHYFYTDSDIVRILKKSQDVGAKLIICTEKDYFKIPRGWRNIIGYALMDLEVLDDHRLLESLLKSLDFVR